MTIFARRLSSSRTSRIRSHSLGIQHLEARLPMAGDIQQNWLAGEVTINGTSGNDQAWVTELTNSTGLDMLRVTLRYGNTTVQREFPKLEVELIKFYGANGNDRFEYIGTSPVGPSVMAYGGAGNDEIKGSPRGDVFFGEAGVDEIYGLGGHDYISGGDGADYLAGHDGNDVIEGGPGGDTLSGFSGDDLLYGHDGNDTLWGSTGADSMWGGNDDDRLYGGDQDDRIWGDAGEDFVSGEKGNDLLYGGIGHDSIYGSDGNDELYGHAGNDYLSGGAGNDQLWGHEGFDRLYGGNGNDQMVGGADQTPDYLQGGTGTDTFHVDCFAGGNLDAPKDFRTNEGDRMSGSCPNGRPAGGATTNPALQPTYMPMSHSLQRPLAKHDVRDGLFASVMYKEVV